MAALTLTDLTHALDLLKVDLKHHTHQTIEASMVEIRANLLITHEDMMELKLENAKLGSELSNVQSENKLLSDEVVQLKKQMNANLRYSLKRNVLIHGIPENQTEDPVEIVKGVISDWGLNISHDLEGVAHRLGKRLEKNNHHIRPIICSFLRRSSVQIFIKESLNRKKKGLTQCYASYHLTRDDMKERKETLQGRLKANNTQVSNTSTLPTGALLDEEAFPTLPGCAAKVFPEKDRSQRSQSQRSKTVPKKFS